MITFHYTYRNMRVLICVEFAVRPVGIWNEFYEFIFEDGLQVNFEIFVVFFEVFLKVRAVFVFQREFLDFLAQLVVIYLAADVHDPRMHAGADIIAHNGLAFFLVQAQHYHQPAGHVFAKKILGCPANYDNRIEFLVSFHVDADPVTDTAFHKYFAAAHGMPHNVAGVAAYDHPAVIHGVAYPVLPVGVYNDRRPVHESRQVVAGNAVYGYFDILAPQPVADIPLAVDVIKDYILLPAFNQPDYLLVQLFIMDSFRVYVHTSIPEPETICLRYSFGSDISPKSSLSRLSLKLETLTLSLINPV